jgi:hypothetical protein
MPRITETRNCNILLDPLPQLKLVVFNNDLGPTLLNNDFSIATGEM